MKKTSWIGFPSPSNFTLTELSFYCSSTFRKKSNEFMSKLKKESKEDSCALLCYHFFVILEWILCDNDVKTVLAIAYVRVCYIKISTWLRGFWVKIANFSRLHCLAILRRDLNTKKTKPNIEKWPESLGVMYRKWAIIRISAVLLIRILSVLTLCCAVF